jgi:hypothetical protein
VTVDRGRYSPQSPTLETLRRIGIRQRKSAQDQDHAHLPRSKNPRNRSAPKNPLTPRRHIRKTRVDSYILGALSSWLPFVVASSVLTDE